MLQSLGLVLVGLHRAFLELISTEPGSNGDETGILGVLPFFRYLVTG